MIRFASVPANVQVIEDYLKNVLDEYKIDQCRYPNILVSITEAVTNAMVHGNKLDENKYVQLNATKLKQCICFRISDEGAGFNPEAIPDPTLPENIEKCGGRGVFLMQKLSDRVVFYDNGRSVEIQFSL